MSDLDWSTNDRSCLRPISSYAVNDRKGLIAWSSSWGWSSAGQLPEKLRWSWHVAWTNYPTRLIRPTFGEAMAEHGLVHFLVLYHFEHRLGACLFASVSRYYFFAFLQSVRLSWILPWCMLILCVSRVQLFSFYLFFFRNSNPIITLFLLAHTHTHTYQALWVVDMLGSWSWPLVLFSARCMAAPGGTWFSEGRLQGELPVVSICNNRWSTFLYAAWAQRCPVFDSFWEKQNHHLDICWSKFYIECSNMSSANYWPDKSVTRFIHTKWQPTFCAPSCERRGSLSMFSKANHFDAV